MRLVHVFFCMYCTCYKIHYAFDFFALCLGPVQRCKNNIIGAKYYDSNMLVLGGGKEKAVLENQKEINFFFSFFFFVY